MAFDRNKPADLLALKNEVANDPNGQNYAAAGGATAITLGKLNDPTQNVGSPNINRPAEELDIPDIAEVISESEYAAASAYDKQWVQMFINRPEDVKLKPYQAKFMLIFPSGSATLTAVLALRVKKASRAETLFGVNTVISRQDWFAARNS